jgi:hypothetical protein
MINNLPTIYEVVTGAAKRQSKEKTPNTNSSSKSNKPSSKVVSANAFFVIICMLPGFLVITLVPAAVEGRASCEG